MKILHSADWHLDAPLAARSPALRRELLTVPGQIARLCRREQCDLVLLSGDLFDGPCSPESLQALKSALEDMAVPVFIAPGNHDHVGPDSPWQRGLWPDNVHIFTDRQLTGVDLPGLSCRVYGAAFSSMDCPGLLEGFRAAAGKTAVCVLHGDPTQADSPYCPITQPQVRDSGLSYLALGHIHKHGSFTAGNTLCAWPGCPMGHGYDEQGEKGVLIVTLEDTAQAQFVPLDTTRFYDLQAEVTSDPADAIGAVLPAMGNQNYYRITLTGQCAAPDLPALYARFAHFPNLQLQDHTSAPLDLWGSADEDSLEGTYFGLLRAALEGADEQTRRRILLAAKISRQLLSGQEVTLP